MLANDFTPKAAMTRDGFQNLFDRQIVDGQLTYLPTMWMTAPKLFILLDRRTDLTIMAEWTRDKIDKLAHRALNTGLLLEVVDFVDNLLIEELGPFFPTKSGFAATLMHALQAVLIRANITFCILARAFVAKEMWRIPIAMGDFRHWYVVETASTLYDFSSIPFCLLLHSSLGHSLNLDTPFFFRESVRNVLPICCNTSKGYARHRAL